MRQPRRRGFAETTVTAKDEWLRGRTYAIPFEDVWQAAIKLASGGIFRWTCLEADDHDGVILASSKGLTGALHDIMVRITLDEDGQTRVDASAQARSPFTNFGRSKRRIRRFFRKLDRVLARSSRDAQRSPEPVS